MAAPDLNDYLALFRLYGGNLGAAYRATNDERYRLLFEQLCHLLAQASAFNGSLPEPFRRTARAYLADDPDTVASMLQPENRNFMISDISDYIDLLARRRGGEQAAKM